MHYTLGFEDISKKDAHVAGGKGASLGEMTRAGIPVPPGFVILAPTFDHFIKESGLEKEINFALAKVDIKTMQTIEAASKDIEALIQSHGVPDSIQAEVLENFRKLGTEFVAVRSSATAEDGSEHAWAGQLESYLNTTEETLIENIKNCWASLFTPRAIFYRLEKGLGETSISVAVVVQKMIHSEKSGIAFSVHPVTEDPRELIIEAGYGLGEAMVSGTVTPDSYIVRKDTKEIINKKISIQTKALYRKEGGGNEWREIEPELGGSQVLSDEDIAKLSEIIIKIEAHYGFPCDIEWAFEGGEFYITQSRPITTLSKNTPSEAKKNFVFMWGQKQSAMLTEAMMNQVLCAFDEDGNIVSSNVPETLFILSDGVFSHYMPEEVVRMWNSNSKIYSSEKYARNIFKGLEQHISDYFKFCENVRSTDFSQLTNTEIKNIFIKYQNFIIKTFQYYGTSNPSGTAYLVEEIRRILGIKIKDQEMIDDYFIKISTPAELDETMKERLDFLKIADQEEVADKDLEDYAHTYPALFFNTYSREDVLGFLRERLVQQRHAGFNFKDESNKMQLMLDKIALEHKKIYTEFSGTRLEEFADLLQRAGLGRYRLKHTWSGGEYLCLNMIEELQKRIGIDFDDFVKTYSISDIDNFLEKGIVLDKDEMQNRRKCLVIHYYEGKKHPYIGDGALAYKDARIPVHHEAHANVVSIKGDIANKGLVTGRARIIFVQDLKQFIKDSESFQKNEILVTTMTSPIMIPILEKAGAIIADEGGICSHAAISAREFGIPCIIGTENACSKIKDGDLLEVDANQGVVKILERA